MRLFVVLLCVLSSLPQAADAIPTRIAVFVISKGGKFIGTSMGGALVTVRDADTGELLARGVTHGSSGDTEKIMRDPKPHHAPVTSQGVAGFVATIDIDEPRRIEVSAYGPLAARQSANRASSTMWVMPGKHITGGNGWLLELGGFSVTVLEPPSHVFLQGANQTVRIRANVTMMCGCHVAPGGLWDSEGLEMQVLLEHEGKLIDSKPLRYSGEPSLFEAEIQVRETGAYEAVVYVYDPSSGNTGVDNTTFVVTP
jgi:hypothetical protein